METDKLTKYVSKFHKICVGHSSKELDLVSLVHPFEQNVIQSSTVSVLELLKIIANLSINEPTTRGHQFNGQVAFWAFQYHHCEFMAPIVKKLKQIGISVDVIIFRENLVSYLEQLEINPILIKKKLVKKKPFTALSTFIGLLFFVLALITTKQPRAWKKAALASLKFLSGPQLSLHAVKHVVSSGKHKYHVAGHDITAQGLSLGNALKWHHKRTGRIQNGAVNSMLCGYSPVDDVFFWDIGSEDEYRKKGWDNSAHIVGNIKLWQKLETGIKPEWKNWVKSLEPNIPIIMVAFSGYGYKTSYHGHMESIEFLNKLVAEVSDAHFLIKLHPKDKREHYAQVIQHKNAQITSDNSFNPDALDVLLVSDIVITGGSSVALDAISLKLPVISIDPIGEMKQFDFLNNELVTRWTSMHDDQNIKDCIRRISYSDKRELSMESPVDKIVAVIENRLDPTKSDLDVVGVK